MTTRPSESRARLDPTAALQQKGHDTIGVRPAITPENEPFWKGAARGDLLVEMCLSCGLHIFPPRGICRRCRGRTMEWVQLDPPGVIYSVTTNQHAWAPDVDPVYVAALVEFPQYSGIRFVGFVVGFDDEPPIGTLVDFGFHPAMGGLHRLHFTPWTDS